jgi:ATP-dependent protease ClpP protease subunit
MNARSWYSFKNATETEVELYLYDEIGFFGVGAKQFISDLRANKGKHLHLRINSPGGEVVEGTAIYNALSRHEGGVTVHIDALAASMASVIAMSGNPVYMADNALLMIHDPWIMAGGNSEELRKNADLLDTMKNNLVRAYTKKTGIPEDEIATMMGEETWMDSTTAVALGFVDAIEDGVQAAAHMTPEIARARFDSLRKAMDNTTILQNGEIAETPIVEAPLEPKTETPVVVEETAVEPETPAVENSGDLVASIQAIKNELATIRAERDQISAQLNLVRTELAIKATENERLAAAAGIAPADVLPPIGSHAEPGKSLLDQFNEISDPSEKTRFYKKHAAELKQLSAQADKK